MIAAAIRLGPRPGRWLLGFGGVLSVVWGGLLAFMPIAGAYVITLWLGAYALVFGIALLLLAFKLRRARRRDGSTPTPARA